ncbi:MAG: S8 family serine peptidase, partial [Elusimicrobia bacterium]|nr:S8 family serine peptidase [Elusimicrobiota bacterium]
MINSKSASAGFLETRDWQGFQKRGMRMSFLLALIFLSLSLSDDLWAQGRKLESEKDYVEGELLVKVKKNKIPTFGKARQVAKSAILSLAASVDRDISKLDIVVLKMPQNALAFNKDRLSKNSDIEWVSPNYLFTPDAVPNDPGYGQQWHLPKISAPQGWDITQGDLNVKIAMIDVGFQMNHPDLQSKFVSPYNADDGTSNVTSCSHGTRTAGILGAVTNNGLGVAGLAWQNGIMPIQSNSFCEYLKLDGVLNGIIYAADYGAKVINMSFGSETYSPGMQEAVNYAWNKGLVLVASTGNTGNTANSIRYPAAMEHVVAVGATDENDQRAYFSQYGSYVDLVAPGVNIYTTDSPSSYGSATGTSYSAPLVSSLAGLVWSKNPGWTNEQVVCLMLNNADDLGAFGRDDYYGSGRVNVDRTLSSNNAVCSIPPKPPPPSPVLWWADLGPGFAKDVMARISSQNVLVTGQKNGKIWLASLSYWNGLVQWEISFNEGVGTRIKVIFVTGNVQDHWEYYLSGSLAPNDTCWGAKLEAQDAVQAPILVWQKEFTDCYGGSSQNADSPGASMGVSRQHVYLTGEVPGAGRLIFKKLDSLDGSVILSKEYDPGVGVRLQDFNVLPSFGVSPEKAVGVMETPAFSRTAYFNKDTLDLEYVKDQTGIGWTHAGRQSMDFYPNSYSLTLGGQYADPPTGVRLAGFNNDPAFPGYSKNFPSTNLGGISGGHYHDITLYYSCGSGFLDRIAVTGAGADNKAAVEIYENDGSKGWPFKSHYLDSTGVEGFSIDYIYSTKNIVVAGQRLSNSVPDSHIWVASYNRCALEGGGSIGAGPGPLPTPSPTPTPTP